MSKPITLRINAVRPTDFAGAYERQRSLAELSRMMRVERERHGLTHDQFAQALGIKASDIVRLERGGVSPI